MKLPLILTRIAVLSSLVLATSAFANLSIVSLNSPIVIDFTGFNGSGFSPNPAAGQLDSDLWAVDGLSDGVLDFGGTATSGDFARGTKSAAVGTGGIYAFDLGGGDVALGIQPGGTDWAPGSVTLRVQNNTGATLTSLSILYSLHVYNDQNRASSFNFFHSTDNLNYDQIGLLDFESPAAASSSPEWLETSLATTISGLSIVDGGNYYLQWSGGDYSGSGGRDQFGLDDISITGVVPEPMHFGLIFGSIILFFAVKKRTRI